MTNKYLIDEELLTALQETAHFAAIKCKFNDPIIETFDLEVQSIEAILSAGPISEPTFPTWQPIETMPKEGNFVALDQDNETATVDRYKNPFGEEHTVINRRTGRWFSPIAWMPLPKGPNDE